MSSPTGVSVRPLYLYNCHLNHRTECRDTDSRNKQFSFFKCLLRRIIVLAGNVQENDTNQFGRGCKTSCVTLVWAHPSFEKFIIVTSLFSALPFIFIILTMTSRLLNSVSRAKPLSKNVLTPIIKRTESTVPYQSKV